MAGSIKLIIDGMEVEAKRGRTILEVARSVGIRIPTLCDDRRLLPFGACRLCVVEVKGGSELLPSCFTPVGDGMEVYTHSPRVLDARRLQLQLILLNHPMICPRCEREGECELQRLLYEYGLQETQYPWEPIRYPVDDSSPLLFRDGNKCILCGRCVRICEEVQGVGELSFTRRGIRCVIDTDFHRPLRCEFCGQCLDTCPVGAITSECFDYGTKLWECLETTTPCPYCGCGCLLTIASKGGEIKRVYSDPLLGSNDGNLCVKGRFGWDFVNSSQRLRSPLLRVNGSLREVSWEEALGVVYHRLESISERHGAEGIGVLLSSRLTNEEYYLFRKLFVETLGTGEIVLDGGVSGFGLSDGLSEVLGYGVSTNSIGEIRGSDVVLVVGGDPSLTHPIVKNEMHLAIRRNRARLIVLGSYDIALSEKTRLSPLQPPSIFLSSRPGEEVRLLVGMVGLILEEGLQDVGFIHNHTEGFETLFERKDEYLRILNGLSPESRELLGEAVRSLSRAKSAMILICPGSWSYSYARQIGTLCGNLALLTGHLGREATGILLLLERCNTQGLMDMKIPFLRGGLREMESKISRGQIKGLYAVGERPISSLEGLEFLVVQDLFANALLERADLVLPVSSFVEKEGSYTSLERRVQGLHPIRASLGQSRSDFEIFRDLLKRFEVSLPGETPSEVLEGIKREVSYYQGIEDGRQWPRGARFLSIEDFPFRRLVPLSPPETKAPPEGYPYVLIERPSLFQSGSLSLRSEHLRKVMERPVLEMNPEEARSLGIEEGDWVKVLSSDGGEMEFMVHLSRNPSPGVLLLYSPHPLDPEREPKWVRIETKRGKIS